MIHTNEAILLGCDIDGTSLAGHSAEASVQTEAKTALGALTMSVAHCRNRRRLPVFFGTVTGRTPKSHEELEQENLTFKFAVSYMDFVISSVGTEIAVRKGKYEPRTHLDSWPNAENWNPHKIRELLLSASDLGTVQMQPDIAQSAHKLSLYANTELGHDAYASQVGQRLAELGVAAHVVFSGGEYLDLLPKGVDGNAIDKGGALLHCGDYLATRDQLDSRPRIIFAGDSENDMGGFIAATQAEGFGIIPGNANPEFKQWARSEFGDSVYIADQPFAAGVQEGFEHFTRSR